MKSWRPFPGKSAPSLLPGNLEGSGTFWGGSAQQETVSESQLPASHCPTDGARGTGEPVQLAPQGAEKLDGILHLSRKPPSPPAGAFGIQLGTGVQWSDPGNRESCLGQSPGVCTSHVTCMSLNVLIQKTGLSVISWVLVRFPEDTEKRQPPAWYKGPLCVQCKLHHPAGCWLVQGRDWVLLNPAAFPPPRLVPRGTGGKSGIS